MRQLIAILGLFVFAVRTPAQTPAPYHLAGDRLATSILVKLREGSAAGLDSTGRLFSRSGTDLQQVAALFARAARTEPLVRRSWEQLETWHRHAEQVLPAGAVRPGHLGLWFRLEAEDATDGRVLLGELLGSADVEDAYLEPILTLAGGAAAACGEIPLPEDLPPPTPDFTAYQTYLADAPVGFGFAAVRSILGARGEPLRFYHLEEDWFIAHEDLESLDASSFMGPVSPQGTAGANHGTAVVGLVAAARNGFGLTGVADLARVRLASWGLNGGIANTIAMAIADGQPGDVIAIIAGYNLRLTKPNDYVPAEYFQANFDAILTASTQGLVLVEASLNGDNDLDDPRFARRFDLSFRDSGAILVGATEGGLTSRASFSNYGSRIDANGWGDQVATIGYGDLFYPNRDDLQAYTQHAAGTSAATTAVSGVLVSLEGAARRQLERALSPSEVRSLLRNHGTAVTGEIGLRPDLRAMLTALGLPDGLRVDRHEVALGSSFTLTMSAPAGGGFALSLALLSTDLDLGLGRHLHLEPTALIPLGSFALPTGSASYLLTAPIDPALRDLDLYFQGVIVDATASTIRLSSSLGVHLH